MAKSHEPGSTVLLGLKGYLVEKLTEEEALGFIQDREGIYLGLDEHSFRHQEPGHTITKVKQRRVVGILKDDRIATLKKFLTKRYPGITSKRRVSI